MGDRCTGRCCQSFWLHDYTPAQVEEWKDKTEDPEHRKVFGMVFPVAFDVESQSWRWSCVHFNRETRQCGDYENRPNMCRDFPYWTPCPFPGCEWDKGVSGAHGRAGRRPGLVVLQ